MRDIDAHGGSVGRRLRLRIRASSCTVPPLKPQDSEIEQATAVGLTVVVSVVVKSPMRTNPPGRFGCSGVVVRGRIELPTFRFSGGRSYRLSYLTSTRAADLRHLPRPTCGPQRS